MSIDSDIWKYGSTHSSLDYEIEMNGQIQAAAVLYPGIIDPKSTEYETRWNTEPFSSLGKETNIFLCRESKLGSSKFLTSSVIRLVFITVILLSLNLNASCGF
jgi:hypothetical protein